MIIVARDGSGDFTTIQEAVDSLPEKCDGAPREILIRPGEYREKKRAFAGPAGHA